MEDIRKQAENEASLIENYVTNEDTYMILPVRAIEYSSIVLDKNAIYYVKQTPLEIIKHSCWELAWTTYEGRRKAIAEKLSLPYKTPMMLSKEKETFTFPTKSPINADCSWIFIHPDVQINQRSKKHAILLIGFQNIVTLDISYHTLQSQYEKAFQLRTTILSSHMFQNPF